VRLWQNTAVVTALLWEKGTNKGTPFDYKLWFSDTYVRTASGWRYVFGQASLPLPQTPNAVREETVVTTHARGTFEVRLTPQASGDSAIGRMSFDKQFQGDLEGTSKGEMLTGGSVASGSGGYVAMELVSGTLHGRRGTFVLQHSGTMTPQSQHLTVSVVPASGTGQLVGIAGTMTITIADGKHSYDFEYALSETR
jgi:hypothetical protein